MHDWRLPLWKTCSSFKTMKNIKVAQPVLNMNSFYDYKKKVKIPLRK